MKYLFYDCECANSFDKISKICSLGYVLTDEKFNIIKEEDIIINPEDKFDYHLFLNKSDIHLAYDRKTFYKAKNFKDNYNKILELFNQEDILVFGFSIDNDIRYLLDACKRYKLPFIKFRYVDIQVVYKAFAGDALKTGLDNAAKKLNIDENVLMLHKSDYDAYLSMKILEKIVKTLDNKSMDEILSIYNIDVLDVDTFINLSIERKKRKELAARLRLEQVLKVKSLTELYDKLNSNPTNNKYAGMTFCYSKQVIKFADKAIKAQKEIYDGCGITTKDYIDGAIVIVGHKEKLEEYNEKGIKYISVDELISG